MASMIDTTFPADDVEVSKTDFRAQLAVIKTEIEALQAGGLGDIVGTSLSINGSAAMTAILDEDNLASDSAAALATQQSIKAYVDAQVTAQDLVFAADSGTGAVDLDSQSLTITGGTGINTSATGQAATVAIDSTVTTNTDTQTLTNKTITDAVGTIQTVEVTVNQSEVAAAASKTLLASTGKTYKIRDIFLEGSGTNFSGGSGDRNLTVSDGTTTWSILPASTLQALKTARWGQQQGWGGVETIPFPTSATALTTASAADIVAQYSGGTADYTAGELKLIILAERTS